jgi:hypothetical protein
VTDPDVRAFIYRQALSRGVIPHAAEIAAYFQASLLDVRASFTRLADAHMLVLEPEGGEILMAMPFSAVPTSFVAESAFFRSYGNCVWDGLGILAMLHRDGIVETSCGCCGAAMELRVEHGLVREIDGVVHFGVPVRHWWDDVAFA